MGGGHHNELLMCFRFAASLLPSSTAQTEWRAHNAAHNCGVGGVCAVVKSAARWLRTKVEVDNRRRPSTHLLVSEELDVG